MNEWKLGDKVKVRFIWMEGTPMEKRTLWIEAIVINRTPGGHPVVLYLHPITAEYEVKALEHRQIEKLD